jgi:hypothetical protein
MQVTSDGSFPEWSAEKVGRLVPFDVSFSEWSEKVGRLVPSDVSFHVWSEKVGLGAEVSFPEKVGRLGS